MGKPPTQSDDSVADEEDLLQRLADIAAEIDPPPEMAYEFGRQLFSLGRLDDELADLVADSAVDASATRAATTDVRLLSFDCSSTTVDVQVSADAAGLVVLGMISAGDDFADAGSADVELHSVSGAIRSTTADLDGRFEFADVKPSLVRFVLRIEGLRVRTAWVRL